MRITRMLFMAWMSLAAAMQSIAAEVDPNSGCAPDDPAAHRQRPGEPTPERDRKSVV